MFKVIRLRYSGKIAFWCAFDRAEFILTKHLVQKVGNARHLRGCLERGGVDCLPIASSQALASCGFVRLRNEV